MNCDSLSAHKHCRIEGKPWQSWRKQRRRGLKAEDTRKEAMDVVREEATTPTSEEGAVK